MMCYYISSILFRMNVHSLYIPNIEYAKDNLYSFNLFLYILYFIIFNRIIREEGLLCGGSSGATMSCALLAAKDLKEGQRCVVLMADSVRNYMSKFLSDAYMWDNDFVDGVVVKKQQRSEWWAGLPISSLPLSSPVSVSASTTCREAITLMHQRSFDMVNNISLYIIYMIYIIYAVTHTPVVFITTILLFYY